MQRRRLTEKASAIRVFDHIIFDRNFNRPDLAEMLGFCRASDTTCVARLDRLGRSLKVLLETSHAFKARGSCSITGRALR